MRTMPNASSGASTHRSGWRHVRAALVLRVLLAPRLGFYGDLRLYGAGRSGSRTSARGDFYTPGQFVDYPPGYLYVLWLDRQALREPGLPAAQAARRSSATSGSPGSPACSPRGSRRRRCASVARCGRSSPQRCCSTRPSIALERRLGTGGRRSGVVRRSSSLLLLFTGRPSLQRDVAAFLLFAVAVAMKPQSGFVLPVMLYALYRRYLHRRHGDELVDGVARGRRRSEASSFVTWAVSGLAVRPRAASRSLRFYKQSASLYPVTSANAFNLWGALGFWRNDSTAPTRSTRAPAGRRRRTRRARHAARSSSADRLRALAGAPRDRAGRARGARAHRRRPQPAGCSRSRS